MDPGRARVWQEEWAREGVATGRWVPADARALRQGRLSFLKCERSRRCRDEVRLEFLTPLREQTMMGWERLRGSVGRLGNPQLADSVPEGIGVNTAD